MDFRLEVFSAEHLFQLDKRELEIDELSNFDPGWLEKLGKRYEQGHAYTLFDPDGNAISCGGVIVYWTGVGEAWAMRLTRYESYRAY